MNPLANLASYLIVTFGPEHSMVDVVAAYVNTLRAHAAAKIAEGSLEEPGLGLGPLGKLTFAAGREAWSLVARNLELHGYRGQQGGDILATIQRLAVDEMRASFPKHAERL